jgi:hypothetical protein
MFGKSEEVSGESASPLVREIVNKKRKDNMKHGQ